MIPMSRVEENQRKGGGRAGVGMSEKSWSNPKFSNLIKNSS